VGFRLVPKSVILNDLCVILPNSAASEANYVKMVDDDDDVQ